MLARAVFGVSSRYNAPLGSIILAAASVLGRFMRMKKTLRQWMQLFYYPVLHLKKIFKRPKKSTVLHAKDWEHNDRLYSCTQQN
jgi:hypothetical protein